MKKHILLILLLAAGAGSMQADSCCTPCPSNCNTDIPCDKIVDVGCSDCECKATSHTFFSVRPEWQAASPERLTMFRDRMTARDKESVWKGAFQVAIYGGRSTHEGRLANFFAPFCKSVLNVTEADTADTDLLARDFNIYTVNGIDGTSGIVADPNAETTFQSTIAFAPRRSVVGLGLDYKQAFAEYKDGHYLWWEIAMPITHVKTSMNFAENVVNPGGGAATAQQVIGAANTLVEVEGSPTAPVANMTEAMKQANWKCGKIDNCAPCNSITRIADLDLRLGYDIVMTDAAYLESYLGILIPTGNKACNGYMFEPVVGHNKHFGFTTGSNLGFEVWKSKELDKSIFFDVSMHGLFMLTNRQHRLVDLKNKPWSRYMRVYADQAQAEQAVANDDVYLQTPGVNVFCQDMCVSAGFERTYNAAFILNARGFEGEIGYNFFARSPECVSLKCSWTEGPALKTDAVVTCDDGQVTSIVAGATDSVQTVNHVYSYLNAVGIASYADNIIKASDLDLESAAHPAMLIHTAYGSLGYRWDDYEHPWFIGTGGSYEFSRDNTGMNRWLLWIKGGLSF